MGVGRVWVVAFAMWIVLPLALHRLTESGRSEQSLQALPQAQQALKRARHGGQERKLAKFVD